jgi:DnaJ family protein A protein 2
MRRDRDDEKKGRDFYAILGVEKTASLDDIKRNYKKLAMKYHPDKNPGNPEAAEKFKEISAAYEVLSDPQKKEIYDRYGEEGLQGGGFQASNAQSIFEQFFGGGIFGDMFGGGGRRQGPRKGEDLVYTLGVTLESLYNGKTSKLKVSKNAVCSTCDGKGSEKEGATTKCDGCGGMGYKMIVKQLGPGMISQTQTVCPDCRGEGEMIKKEDRCKTCKGKKTVQESKMIEVIIEKGMKNGQKIVFQGEGDQQPGVVPGDIVIVLQEKKDPECPFTRHENDLLYEQKVTLVEALTGFKFAIKHLDNRNLIVSSQPGDILKPGDIKYIEDEGMPLHKRPFEKGRLIIQFSIIFPKPEELTPDKVKKLKELLPPPAKLPKFNADDVEEVVAKPFNPEAERARQRRGDPHDDDDEGGGQRASCVHQ